MIICERDWKMKKITLFTVLLIAVAFSGTAQTLKTAGTLLVDVSAENITATNGAAVTQWTNDGSLGDFNVLSGNSGATFTNSLFGRKAVLFDGTEQSVLAGDTVPSSLTARNPWSIESWVWVPSLPAPKSVYLSWTKDEGSGSYQSPNRVMLRYDTANVGLDMRGGTMSFGYGTPVAGAWHHIVATRTPAGIERLYVDGNYSQHYTGSVNVESGNPIALGGVMSYTLSVYTNFYAGALSRVRIHTGTLTEEDVLNNYMVDAQNYIGSNGAVWTGGSANWNETANWSNGVVGVAGKAVRILSGTVDVTNNVSSGYLTELDIVSGTVNLTESSSRFDTRAPFVVGRDSGNSATLNFEKGTIAVSSSKGPSYIDMGLNGAESAFTVGGQDSPANFYASRIRAFDGPSDIQIKSGAFLELDGVQSDALTNVTMSVAGGKLRNRAGSTMGFLHNVPQVKVSTGGITLETIDDSIMSVSASLLHDESGPAAGGGLKKIGSGTLVLSSTNAYAGETVVEAGTLKLSPRLLDGLVYRLDSHSNSLSTLEFADTSNVVSWVDAEGSGITFTTNNTEECPVYDATLFGGRGGLRFSSVDAGSPSVRMETDVSIDVQTVFAVVSPGSGNSLGGLFGSSGNDKGLRLTSTTFQYAGDGNDFANNGWVYVDGVFDNGFTVGQPVVLTEIAGSPWTWKVAIGDYWGHATHRRIYKGDIAEILVYNRRLDDHERQEIENHLMAKWLGTVEAPQFSSNLLPEDTDMNVHGGAIVELEGTSVQLGSLDGAGSINNDKVTLSSITVGGDDSDCVFAGRITGNAKLTKTGSGTLSLAGLNSYSGSTAVEAGTLQVIAGTASVTGLVYRLDASQTNSFTTLADGSNVTSWADADGSGYTFSSATDTNCPVYDSSLFDGRGGFRFGVADARSRMVGASSTNAQTVIAVNMIRDTSNNNGGFWGRDRNDFGLRVGGTGWYYPGNANDFHNAANGGIVYINGGISNYTASVGIPHVLTSVSGTLRSFTPAIGDYWFSSTYPERAYKGDVAEILVYNRILSDVERHSVELALMAKWFPAGEGDTILPESSEISVAEGATLEMAGGSITVASLAGGGTVSNGTLTVTGDVAPVGSLEFTETPDLTGTLTMDIAADGSCDKLVVGESIDITGLELVLNLPEDSPSVGTYTLISATDGVTGPFESAVTDGPWSIRYEANSVKLIYASGTLIILQ